MIWNMILNKLKKKQNITKNELECKENEYKQLESFASEKLEEIEIVRDNNQSMISQISENVRMEKKISIQNKIISELKDNLGEKNEFQNNQEDILNRLPLHCPLICFTLGTARQIGQISEYLVTEASLSSIVASRNWTQPPAGRTYLNPRFWNCLCVASKLFCEIALICVAASADPHAELCFSALQ